MCTMCVWCGGFSLFSFYFRTLVCSGSEEVSGGAGDPGPEGVDEPVEEDHPDCRVPWGDLRAVEDPE